MRRICCVALALTACESEISISKPPLQGAIETDVPVDSAPPVPDIEVKPESLDFGSWLRGCPSQPETIQIFNVGGAPLDVSLIEVQGNGQAAFALDGAPGTVLPGESIELEVVFTPGRLATFDQAHVAITSNDPDEPESGVEMLGEGAEVALHQDTFVQNPAAAVDVLFSIDNSGSMSEDIAALGQSFDTFINSFVALGLDYHIAVMTADPDCPDFLGDVITPATPDPVAEFIRQTTLGSCGGEAAFGATKNALSASQLAGNNAGFLRTDANLAVVALSDEPEQTEAGGGLFGCDPPFFSNNCMPVNSYVNFLTGLKGNDPSKVTFSGIVAPRTSSFFSGNCDISLAAPRYHSAINRTGGVFGDLCQLDLDPFLTHLSLVVAGVNSVFYLSLPPESAAPGDLIVEVGGAPVSEGATNGYTYDAAANSIELHGAAVPNPGQAVSVSYRAEGSCVE